MFKRSSSIDKVTISVEISKSIYAAAGIREAELAQMMREALAVDLYRQRRISFGKAAEIANLSVYEMIEVLARHDIFLASDVHDATNDLAVIEELMPK